jgi:hypothetical protein
MTILGRHTISETKALLNLMEWRIDNLNDVVVAYKRDEPTIFDKDPTLVRDWDTLIARWVDAKGWVKTRYVAALIANPLVGPEVIPDEDNYQALLHAGSTTYPRYTDTDLPGLQARIQKLHPERVLDFGPPPKDFSLDLDLQAYRAADTSAKAIVAAEKRMEQGTQDWASNNYGKIALVAGSAVAAALVMRKLHLL